MMTTDRQQNWIVRKPAARAVGGVVAAQNLAAAEVGAGVLRDGGNAVDAAIAAAFAVSVLEPWMSGVGGGGMMLVRSAAERRVRAIAFGMVAPAELDPADYTLGPSEGGDLFPWPTVVGNHNVLGPLSVAVPGHVAGLALAHERFASRPWAELLAPAVALAEEGLPVSWHTTVKIAASARELRRFDRARETYLPDGLPPVPNADGTLPRLSLGRLPATLRRLAEAGPREFYEGEIARALVEDVRAAGGRLSPADLARYRAAELDPLAVEHGGGGATVHAVPGLTAGPTLRHALELIGGRVPRGEPGVDAYVAWAEALFAAYERRLATMGDVADDSRSPACTTHLSVADRHGNLVSLTQTLLSSFGSKVLSPQTGVLLNNGIMWFDPRPGRPNSIAPGKRPLSNMCPVVVTRDGGEPWFALGASGGRRILPAVLQITSMLAACGLDPEDALHRPRVDVSGEATLTADPRLPAEVARALGARFPVLERQHAVYPSLFACPSLAVRDGPAGGGECLGLADPMNPVSGAAG